MKTITKSTTWLYIVTAIFLLSVAVPLSADDEQSESPINFEVSVSADTLTIGDVFTVRIDADYPEDIKLSEPSGKAATGAFILKSEPEIKSKTRKSRKYDEYTFTLSVFETGDLEIPVFEFFWYDSEGNQNVVKSPTRNIYIKSILPADTTGLEIKDIIGPKPLPRHWWPYIIAILVAAAVGVFIYWLYKRKMKAVEIPQAPLEPPYDAAIRQLTVLKGKDLPGKGKIKQYYIELSDIVRYYIQGRFNIIAVEATTYELKRSLNHPDLVREKSSKALSFLSRTDMVKFAKHTPEQNFIAEDYDLVKDFVVTSKPFEKPVEQVGAVK